MKLRNKKTGEIRPAEAREDGIYLYDETTEQWYKYELDLLAEWWEYYEEPKEYWYIYAGKPHRADCGDILEEDFRAIGNHFETKEETEKAVKKLKAWKRLQDKGFEFTGWKGDEIEFINECPNEVKDIEEFESDLDLLFGGEE